MLVKLIAVFIGGGLGSMARFGTSVLLTHVFKGVFPVATLLSNIASCLILGLAFLLMGSRFNLGSVTGLLLLVGFCGGFSTFSAFSFETVQLIKSGNTLYALLNVLVSLGSCFLIIYVLAREN